MNLELQRAVDRWAGIPLCGAFSLVERLRGRREPARPPRRILVILLSEMGSLVLARPMFAWLRERHPTAELHVALFERNREALELLGVIPAGNVIAIGDSSPPELLRGLGAAVRGFFAKPFDVAIDCELFSRVGSILSYLSGAAVRVGFHPHTQEGLYRGSFINRPVLYNPYRHIADQFLTLAAAIESTTVPKGKEDALPPAGPPPPVAFSEEELRVARERLLSGFPGVRGKKLVLLNPGGGKLPIRAWPLEHYFAVCAELLRDGHAVGVIGLPEDRALGRAFRERFPDGPCLDLTGATARARELLALFHSADLLISNDGGAGHLVSLTPLPAIVLFGPETPVLYGNLGRTCCSLFSSWPCSPCLSAYNHRRSPCDGDNRCLKVIAPQQVLARAREMLR